jgi:hypothetical protein
MILRKTWLGFCLLALTVTLSCFAQEQEKPGEVGGAAVSLQVLGMFSLNQIVCLGLPKVSEGEGARVTAGVDDGVFVCEMLDIAISV